MSDDQPYDFDGQPYGLHPGQLVLDARRNARTLRDLLRLLVGHVETPEHARNDERVHEDVHAARMLVSQACDGWDANPARRAMHRLTGDERWLERVDKFAVNDRVKIKGGLSAGRTGTIRGKGEMSPIGVQMWRVDVDGHRERLIREDSLTLFIRTMSPTMIDSGDEATLTLTRSDVELVLIDVDAARGEGISAVDETPLHERLKAIARVVPVEEEQRCCRLCRRERPISALVAGRVCTDIESCDRVLDAADRDPSNMRDRAHDLTRISAREDISAEDRETLRRAARSLVRAADDNNDLDCENDE